MTFPFSVDPDRLWTDVMALAAITDPERPYTRRSFSALFLKGREWLARRFDEAGLDVRIDTAGNLIGRREGADAGLKTIMLGSHSDTVPSGGRFDGIAGVIAALETARSLTDAAVVLRHPLEVVDFLAEEPSEYGLSCVGSRGMAGALEADMLALKNSTGEPLGSGLRRVGGDPERLAESKRADIDAFLELHIEQGVVLESEGVDVGIVTSIVGIRRMEIAFEGEADHAGTTPMGLRRDALVAGARTVELGPARRRGVRRRGWRILCRDGWHSRSFALGLQCRARPLPPVHRRALDVAGHDKALCRADRPRECGPCQRRAGETNGLLDPLRRAAGGLRSAATRRARSRREGTRLQRA